MEKKLTESIFIQAWLHWYKKSINIKECRKDSFDTDCSFCKFSGYAKTGSCILCPAYGLWSGSTGTCMSGEWRDWHNDRTKKNAMRVLKVIEKAYKGWKANEDQTLMETIERNHQI
jgi:hypothetical protein